MDIVKDNNTGVSVQGILLNNLKFADDIDLLEECGDILQDNLRRADEAGRQQDWRSTLAKQKP